jgi:hypothetical protein
MIAASQTQWKRSRPPLLGGLDLLLRFISAVDLTYGSYIGNSNPCEFLLPIPAAFNPGWPAEPGKKLEHEGLPGIELRAIFLCVLIHADG